MKQEHIDFINNNFADRTVNYIENPEIAVTKLNAGYVVKIGCQTIALRTKEEVSMLIEIFLTYSGNELSNVWYKEEKMNLRCL